MRSRRSWWMIFGLCAAIVLAALAWITVTVAHLERAEAAARADARHQEVLRLALWRMDSWLAQLLAREAARPYFDYQSFYPQASAYTSGLNPIESGEVLTPSPLLSYQSEYFPLHYQVAPDGRVTSPQVPSGALRRLAEDVYLPAEQIVTNASTLNQFSNLKRDTVTCVADFESQNLVETPTTQPAQVSRLQEDIVQQLGARQDWVKRQGASREAVQQKASPLPPTNRGLADAVQRPVVDVGSLVPFWSSAGRGPADELVFARSVQIGDQQFYQGFLCDWPKLRAALLDQIEDLFPGARLVRVAAPLAETSATMLATIPVMLEVAGPVPVAGAFMSPARWTLGLTWLAVLGGLVAVAVTLRASVAFGQKRSRFAFAVTHELRTPLTTFQMYSEMLADGMVQDPKQRQVYLDTLKEESGRLSNLVANVLAYARLEEGRTQTAAAETTLGELLSSVCPPLSQRAVSAGMELRLTNEAPKQTELAIDTRAVGQILFNLVDNACKYAAGADDKSIELKVRLDEGRAIFCVRDRGPGVPSAHLKTIFSPFERGGRDSTDAIGGVGLGLALARGLAADLGGGLELVSPPGGGACFKLSLPLG